MKHYNPRVTQHKFSLKEKTPRVTNYWRHDFCVFCTILARFFAFFETGKESGLQLFLQHNMLVLATIAMYLD